jgi:hypothetical protein
VLANVPIEGRLVEIPLEATTVPLMEASNLSSCTPVVVVVYSHHTVRSLHAAPIDWWVWRTATAAGPAACTGDSSRVMHHQTPGRS